MFSCQKIDTLVKVEASLLYDFSIKSLKKIVLKPVKKTPFISEDQIAESITLNQNQGQVVKIGIQKRRLRLGEIEVKEWEIEADMMIEEEEDMMTGDEMTEEVVMMTEEEDEIATEMIEEREADEVQALTNEARGVQVPTEDDKN